MGESKDNTSADDVFTAAELATLRQEARARLHALMDDDNNNTMDTPAFFAPHGFVKVNSFVTPEECQRMKEEMQGLVVNDWQPETDGLDSFGTDDDANTARGDYFLESADRVHYFAEPTALTTTDSNDRPVLREAYRQSDAAKVTALNKAGHALHMQEKGVFRDYARSDKLRELVVSLGWRDPVVPQSMYIFKQARHGATVHSHQDATFLYTTPRPTCLGLWLALDAATLENGCLWVRPGSQTEPVRRQYCRNPDHFGAVAVAARSNDTSAGDATAPKFVMRDLVQEAERTPWEGSLPANGWQGLLDAGFVPVECQPGDLLAFDGRLDHLSLPNYSAAARHTFQLHLVEGPSAGVTWSPSNWLQYPQGRPFLRLCGEEDDEDKNEDPF
jgi:phytanoyl-CoA hydroxylase